MPGAADARTIFTLVRKGIDARAVHVHVRKPFRFLLCGDPALIAEFRALMLSGHDESVPPDAAACLETIRRDAPLVTNPSEVRAVVFLGRPGDAAASDLSAMSVLRVPILALTVDPLALSSGPPAPPSAGSWAEYVVPAIAREPLRGRFFPHLVECAKGVEIAVGRRLPVLRDCVASKLTRDAANNALKVALASAVVDHIPVVGIVLGAVASAGDMVAITGIQVMLMLHIEAVYGRDPDVQRTWQVLPVIGGGFGWRTLARELAGFVPVAGIAIKGAIAYAGTIVVGEGVTFFHEHGSYMTKGQASTLYERAKDDALRFGRDLIGKLRK
ncbi:MAG: hypothetical protein WB810_17720 [Candidatus Cybelea sp.]